MVTGKTCSSQQLRGFDIQVLYLVLSGYSMLTLLQDMTSESTKMVWLEGPAVGFLKTLLLILY
jgi:hypothetical protein